MNEYLQKNHIDTPNIISGKQDEISNIFENEEDRENTGEYMKKHNIDVFTRLAQYYYGTDGITDYSIYTGEEAQVGNAAYLYTLIKYEGKDILIHIGNGEFNTEVFTKKDKPELVPFFYSPLKLFVVSAAARDQVKESEPEEFLDKYALIYSPKGGKAELRISYKQRENPINYGESSGIVNYQDALLALKNAEIHKEFPPRKSPEEEISFEKFIEKISEIKNFTREELKKRSEIKEGYSRQNDDVKQFNEKLIACLWRLSDGNIKNMYRLVQSFDIHKHVFRT